MPYPRLQKLIAQYGHVPPLELEKALSKCQLIDLKKGAYWLREGARCDYIGFVVRGVLRVFSNPEDQDNISHFCFEKRNPIVSAFSSFITREPSFESIQALEDSQLLILHHYDLQDLYEAHPIFQKLGRLLMEENYVAAKNRIYNLQHKTATQRYVELLDKYPGLIHRVAQQDIAAYLGIAPASLSRLRSKLSNHQN